MEYRVSIPDGSTTNISIEIRDIPSLNYEFDFESKNNGIYASFTWTVFDIDILKIILKVLNNQLLDVANFFTPDLYDFHTKMMLGPNHPAWWWHNEYLFEQLEKDLSSFSLESYTLAADKVFSDDMHSELTALQRYYAYIRTMAQDSFIINTPSVKVDQDGASVKTEEYTELFSSWALNDSISSEAKYEQLCDLLLKSEEMFLIVFNTFESFSELFAFYFMEMVKENRTLRRCKNCGKFFSPKRKNSLFCDESSPLDSQKTCQEYVKYQRYLEQSHVQSSRLYKQIYNQKANKVKRTGNAIMRDNLERFMAQANLFRDSVRNGEMLETDYISWLHSVKDGTFKI